MNALGPHDLVFGSVPVGDRPLFDRLAPVREAGFAGISLMPGDIWSLDMTPEDTGKRIRDAGLAVSEVDCIACWLPSQRAAERADDLGRLLQTLTPERVIEVAARVGARSVTAIDMLGVRPSLDEAAEAFARLCDLGAEHGLLIHIEFLPFGGIPDLASAWAIVEAADQPNGGLTVDSWHLFRSGSTLAQLAAIPGHRIHTVQINDAPATPWDDLAAETMAARLLPGRGSFDLAGMIATLDAIGSTAPIEVEVFHKSQAGRPLEAIAREWSDAARAVLDGSRGEKRR